jgi:hypothetical protein
LPIMLEPGPSNASNRPRLPSWATGTMTFPALSCRAAVIATGFKSKGFFGDDPHRKADRPGPGCEDRPAKRTKSPAFNLEGLAKARAA